MNIDANPQDINLVIGLSVSHLCIYFSGTWPLVLMKKAFFCKSCALSNNPSIISLEKVVELVNTNVPSDQSVSRKLPLIKSTLGS